MIERVLHKVSREIRTTIPSIENAYSGFVVDAKEREVVTVRAAPKNGSIELFLGFAYGMDHGCNIVSYTK